MDTLIKLKNKIITGEWVENTTRGYGGVGRTLESLLGKETENFEIPDYEGIEIKTKCSKKEEYITLFSAVPDSYLFEIKRLHQQYGYPDSKNHTFKVFNLSIYGNRKVKLNSNYFILNIDKKRKQIFLNIYNSKMELIDNYSAWSFDYLQQKLERKLSYLAYFHANRKFELNKVYFKYTSVDFYKLISFDKFIELIEKGIIRITFRIGVYKIGRKYGQIYDHGTCFNIKDINLTKLFKYIDLEPREQ